MFSFTRIVTNRFLYDMSGCTEPPCDKKEKNGSRSLVLFQIFLSFRQQLRFFPWRDLFHVDGACWSDGVERFFSLLNTAWENFFPSSESLPRTTAFLYLSVCGGENKGTKREMERQGRKLSTTL